MWLSEIVNDPVEIAVPAIVSKPPGPRKNCPAPRDRAGKAVLGAAVNSILPTVATTILPVLVKLTSMKLVPVPPIFSRVLRF